MVAIRLCVGCGVRDLQKNMLRIVRRGEKAVVDDCHNLTGRGAWVHPTKTCVAPAVKRKAILRALRVSGQLDTSSLENRLENTMDK
ncbi:MAG TPA: YlxR family protein [Microbacteriaceae bacterium]|nr:YlxR family protein [Microbacteriaceae bacterium]